MGGGEEGKRENLLGESVQLKKNFDEKGRVRIMRKVIALLMSCLMVLFMVGCSTPKVKPKVKTIPQVPTIPKVPKVKPTPKVPTTPKVPKVIPTPKVPKVEKIPSVAGKSVTKLEDLAKVGGSYKNMELAGKTHPVTGVPFVKSIIDYAGKSLEGVFPRFSSAFDTKLPESLYKCSRSEHFKYCTRQLRERISIDKEFAKKFTPRQIEQIKSGSPKIDGYTWHHTEYPGQMQLVDEATHAKTGHFGGFSLWGPEGAVY